MSNSANRRLMKRHGRVVHMVELRCPRCKRGKLLTRGEAAPLYLGHTPLCADCLAEGYRCPMRTREYSSGPIDLHV
jgi:hypothetical protein